jgi:hypothetical protein
MMVYTWPRFWGLISLQKKQTIHMEEEWTMVYIWPMFWGLMSLQK